MRPGGAVIIKTPNPLGGALPLYQPFADPTHWSVLTAQRWAELFEASGFEIVSLRTTLTVPLLWRAWRRLATPLPLPKFGPDIALVARRVAG